MRLISFSTGLKYFYQFFGFLPQFSIIRLRGFLSSFHSSSLSKILCSAELAFEKENNCNNVIFGVENYQSGSHIITIIQNFTLINLTSIITSHPVWLLFRVSGFLQTMHLVSPHLTHLTPHCLCHKISKVSIYESGKTFWL